MRDKVKSSADRKRKLISKNTSQYVVRKIYISNSKTLSGQGLTIYVHDHY